MNTENPAPAAQTKKPQISTKAGLLIICGAVVAAFVFGPLVMDSGNRPSTSDDLQRSYQSGVLFGDGEARLHRMKGNAFSYPINRAEILPLAQAKAQGAGPFSSQQARDKWIDGFTDGFKTYLDTEATKLRSLR